MPSRSPSFPRRQFLAVGAAVPALSKLLTGVRLSFGGETPPVESSLSSKRLPEADLAREVEALLKFVDPKLLHRYQPIDPAKNAWPLWKQANEAFVSEPAGDEFFNDLEKFLDHPANVTAKAQKQIEKWVAQNANCRKLIDAGIARGLYELPRATKSIALEFSTDDMMLPRELARVKSTYAIACLNRGDFKAAFDETVSVLKMGTMLVRAECLAVDYLIARGLIREGAETIFKVTKYRGFPDALARSALDHLSAAKVPVESFKQSYRVEFCRWFIPWIAEFPNQNDAREQAKCFIGGRMFGDSVTNEQTKEFQRAVRQAAILLDGHPNSLDKQATVKLASELAVRFLDALDQPSLKRPDSPFESLKKETSTWPEATDTEAWILHMAGANQAAGKRTDEELRKLNQQLRAVDNVLGKLIIVNGLSSLLAFHDHNDAHLESARLRIALRLYKKQHGKLPAKLDDLADAKLLPAVPLDPFDGAPFRYSPERGTIWSVGKDGKNDGVIPKNPEQSGFNEDINLTWRIAPPAAT